MKKLLPLLLLYLITASANAWNSRGHKIAASIAYDQLGQTKKAMFTELLKRHPYSDEWLEDFKKESGIELGRYLFLRACVWPDDIKGPESNFPFTNETWHYVNFRVDYANGHTTERISPGADILYAMSWGKMIMTQKWNDNASQQGFRYTDESKAVALCWILHLIGDIHQPLHCATLYNEFYPKGDAGGNTVYIRKKDNAKTTYSLHSYWDALLGDGDVQDKTIVKQADEINALFEGKEFPDLDERNPYEWCYQSQRLAIATCYANGIIGNTADYKNKDFGPVLPDNYDENAKELADRQIYFAGMRMATFIKTLRWVE